MKDTKVVTRFAPSPTGFLHLGGARTALFNYLFSKKMGGKFLLRVEDTDKARSNNESIETILNGLKWLGLEWDGDYFLQSLQIKKHQEVAQKLIDEGKAYYCYHSSQELETMREEARKKGEKIQSIWRDKNKEDAPQGVAPTVRLKMPLEGSVTIEDLVMGKISVLAKELDDMILLRSDGSPTYMLSAVVDDISMGITHIIRGDDHLTNTFKQAVLFNAISDTVPSFAHLPLIHNESGKKLSKRDGVIAVSDYENMGILPETMFNYLLRLGFGHKDQEVFTKQEAIDLFGLEKVSKSPARFSFEKLSSLNKIYIKNYDINALALKVESLILQNSELKQSLDSNYKDYLVKTLPFARERFNNLVELAKAVEFALVKEESFTLDKNAKTSINENKEHYLKLLEVIAKQDDFLRDNLNACFKDYAKENDLKLGKLIEPFRYALANNKVCPVSVFDVLEIFGKEKSIARLNKAV